MYAFWLRCPQSISRAVRPVLSLVAFYEEEHGLEIWCESVLGAVRHTVRLVPDDDIPKYPSPSAHLYGESLWYEEE